MDSILTFRLVAAAVLLAIAGAARAQAYPSKPVRIVTSGAGVEAAGTTPERLTATMTRRMPRS